MVASDELFTFSTALVGEKEIRADKDHGRRWRVYAVGFVANCISLNPLAPRCGYKRRPRVWGSAGMARRVAAAMVEDREQFLGNRVGLSCVAQTIRCVGPVAYNSILVSSVLPGGRSSSVQVM